MTRFKQHLTTSAIVALVAIITFGPLLYVQYNRLTEHQREFMLIELKSLKSEYGVCDVLMNSDRKDLQDIMRDVCDKNLKRQAELNKELGQ